MLEEKVVHLLNQMENLSKQYTPEVFDAAVNVIMMNGLVKILGGLSLILFAALCIFACTKLNDIDHRNIIRIVGLPIDLIYDVEDTCKKEL